MRVIQHKPVTRGVTELMYVGDDQATETPPISNLRLMLGATGLLCGLFAKTTFVKAVGWGVAADITVDYLLKRAP